MAATRLHLDRVVQRMQDHHDIAVGYSQAVVDYVIDRCLVQETGARALIGFIDQHILPRLSALWLESVASRSVLTHIDVDIDDARLTPATALCLHVRQAEILSQN